VALCGATIPPKLSGKLDALDGDDAAAAEFGIDFAVAQCADLLSQGVPGLHFYSLNKAAPVTRIVQRLGLRDLSAGA
jgi:methylenetetrahydrofolate reductase (NADPH)